MSDNVLGAGELTELMTSTREKVTTQGAISQVTKNRPSLDALKGQFRNGTGTKLRMTLRLAKNETTAFTDASGSFSLAKNAPILGAALYDWSKPLVTGDRLEFEELDMNAGPEAIVKVITEHHTATAEGHSEKLVEALWILREDKYEADGVTLKPEWAGSFLSFDELISDTVPVGGIDPAVQASWKSSRLYLPESGTGALDIKRAFRRTMNSIEDNGGGRPTLILAGGDVYDEYENSLDEAVRYAQMGTAETRFSELKFDGLVVRRAPELQADRAYFLNVPKLELAYRNGNFMKVREAQVITGTLDFITPTASVIAVGTSERRAHGVLIRAAKA